MLMATHSLGRVGTKPEQVCGEWLSPFPTRFFDPKVSLAPSTLPKGCQHHCFKTLILLHHFSAQKTFLSPAISLVGIITGVYKDLAL